MPANLSQKEWIRALAASDMMAIEAIVSDVCAMRCRGVSEYVLFDGGAHKGYHTIRMANLRGCEAVYAVEADPSMAADLEHILARAKREQRFFATTEIHILEKALQRDPAVKSVTWKSSTSHVGRSSIAAVGEKKTIWSEAQDIVYREDITVEATTIDKLLEMERRSLPFLKLDLEGADIFSLFGARQTLKTKRPIVAFENSVHAPKVHGFEIKEFMTFLEDINYVAVDFFGNRLGIDTWFSFFEAWLTPAENLGWMAEALNVAVGAQSHKLETDFPERLVPQNLSDGGLVSPSIEAPRSEPTKLDAKEMSDKIILALWRADMREEQPVEQHDSAVESDEPSQGFEDRILQVMGILESEDLCFSQTETLGSEGLKGRQWMLDSGRLAWLMWLGARRASYDKDESQERELWSRESGPYRDYVRSALRALQRTGITFASTSE